MPTNRLSGVSAARSGNVLCSDAYDSQCMCADGPLLAPGTSQKQAPHVPAPAAMLYSKSFHPFMIQKTVG